MILSISATRKHLRLLAFVVPSTTRRRFLMTAAPIEPPLHVTERPCSVILAEDMTYTSGITKSSWRESCASRFPETHGMPFQYFSWSSTTNDMDSALLEMKSNLHSKYANNTVLLTRGPWMSWLAQFYLESLPLAGLVMIDPMPLDMQHFVNQFELQYTNHKDSPEYRMFQDFAQHWDHWSLKLEPGAVPMLIAITKPRSVWEKAAKATAARQEGGRFGPVPICKLIQKKQNEDFYLENVVDEFADWIQERVL